MTKWSQDYCDQRSRQIFERGQRETVPPIQRRQHDNDGRRGGGAMQYFRTALVVGVLTILLGVLTMLGMSSCTKEDDQRANALYVEAMKQFDEASNATFDTAMTIYQDGLAKLDVIVEKYPTSNLAVQITSGQLIDNSKIVRIVRFVNDQMKPTLKHGDVLVVFAHAAAPMPGDIVVYRIPRDVSTLYVHRLVGIDGDRIQMVDGLLHINGRPVKRERMEDYVETGEDGRSIRVKRWRETLPNGASYSTLRPDRSRLLRQYAGLHSSARGLFRDGRQS